MFETDDYEALFGRIDQVRDHRGAFLDELAGGNLSLEAVFERAASDPVLTTMKVLPAIEALPTAGKVQTRRAFEEVGIAEDGHIGHVTDEQIGGLAAAMERHAR